MEHILIFRQSDYIHLEMHLLQDKDHEEAAFLLGRTIKYSSGERFVVSEVIIVPVHEYDKRHSLALQISAIFINRILKRAREENKGIILAHSHPFSTRYVNFSDIDDWGDSRLLPALSRHLEHLVGSLVMGQGIARARILYQDGQFEPFDRIRVIGRGIKEVIPFLNHSNKISDDVLARELLAFGPIGVQRLKNLRVGVIGLGGTGSYIIDFLVRLGIKDLLLIDPDRTEISNISRMANSQLRDVGKMKIEVARDSITAICPDVTIHIIPTSITKKEVGLELARMDIVFCCTDNHASRAVLNQISYTFCLPIIDVGTQVVVNKEGVSSVSGKVVRLGPGLPCLWCAEDIDAGRVAEESLPVNERERLVKEGYVRGMNVHEPSVVTYNAVVSALAVTELIHEVTDNGYMTRSWTRLLYNALQPFVKTVCVPRRQQCICIKCEAQCDLDDVPWRS